MKMLRRVGTARWVAESARPFAIVDDRCYKWLQREGRPKHYVPSARTVARDLKKLYQMSREKLGAELQVSNQAKLKRELLTQNKKAYDGDLALALDCWTSPNHHAFLSITVTWLRKDSKGNEELTTAILDFVELPCSHSARNMAEAVTKTLKGYGIARKVSKQGERQRRANSLP